MLRRLNIRSKLILVLVLPIVSIFVVAGLAVNTFNHVRISGPNYVEIKLAQDLRADVLPPPEYIIESYTTALQMSALLEQNENQDGENLASGATLTTLTTQMNRLQNEYYTRHKFWENTLKDANLRKIILKDAYNPADQFFQIVNNELLPLLKNKQLSKAQQAKDVFELVNGKLTQRYNEHRKAIDEVVRISEQQQQTVQDKADNEVSFYGWALVAIFFGLMGLATALCVITIRSISRPIQQLQEVSSKQLPEVIDKARNIDLDTQNPTFTPILLDTDDELAEAASAFNSAVQAAVELASEQARLRRETSETFVNLGRRNQNLVARQLRFIDQLERSETDPHLLAHLFQLDHLATRIRRNAESLLVLAGIDPPRKWQRSIPLLDVVRSALSEVEGYERVHVSAIDPVLIPGYSIADISHLLAELLENALRFSPPDSTVEVRGGELPDGYVLAITDQGLGMSPKDLAIANNRLRDMDIDESPTAYLGLFVVSRLARRYGVQVELDSVSGEGLTAYVTFPGQLLNDDGSSSDPTGKKRARYDALNDKMSQSQKLTAISATPGIPTLPQPNENLPSARGVAPVSARVSSPAPQLPQPESSLPPSPIAPPNPLPPATISASASIPAPAQVPSMESAPVPPLEQTPAQRIIASASILPVPPARSGQTANEASTTSGQESDITRSGLPRRTSKLRHVARHSMAAESMPVQLPEKQRVPEEIRSRYSNFSAGKRRATTADSDNSQ